MTAPVPAHGAIPAGHVDPETYEQIRAQQRAETAPAALPVDFEDTPPDARADNGGEWLADATAEVRAEQAAPAAQQHDGPPPGWYVDTADPTIEKWWDGAGYPGPARPVQRQVAAASPADVERPAAPEDDEAKAAREREAKAVELGATPVPLEGINGRDVVYVLDPNDWPSSANSRLHVGDFESWAEGCLAPGYYDVWLRLDPLNRHVNAMMVAYKEATGQTAGKSRPSARSLRASGRK